MSRLDSVLARLTPEQYRAVTSASSRILCLAGAGSGKTSVLAARIAYLQLRERVGTSNMLALTFTRLAAREMKERVTSLVGEDLAKRLTAGTFHSWCARVLREWHQDVGLERSFSVYDEEDRRAVLETIIGELRYTSQVHPSNVNPWGENPPGPVSEVAEEYRYRLWQHNAVDLEGLLVLTRDLLDRKPGVARELRERYTHVFVDEYQDTDVVQEAILAALAPASLFVVGDPSQAIYGWRGAVIENILTFEQRYPDVEVVRLERNYRSTRPILDAANRLMLKSQQLQPLTLQTDRDGSPPEVRPQPDDGAEAQAAASWARALWIETGTDWREMAVLCRTNRQVEMVEAAMQAAEVPAFVVSGRTDPLNAFDVRRVLDCMAYVCNAMDEWAARRIVNWPDRRISDIALQQLEQQVLRDGSDYLELLARESGLREWRDYFERIVARDVWEHAWSMWDAMTHYLELRSRYEAQGLTNRIAEMDRAGEAIDRWEKSATQMGEPTDPWSFLRWLRTRDVQDRMALEASDGVRVLTIHSAKGLEWDHVYILGVNEGVFPTKRGDREEERRLFYVAITRARKSVTVSYAGRRELRSGQVQMLAPSPFLADAGLLSA